MATLTGANLLDSIMTSTGIQVNDLLYATLSAKLQQMIDNNTYSKLAAGIASSGFSTEIRDATDISELSDAVETNVNMIEAATEADVTEGLPFPGVGVVDGTFSVNNVTVDEAAGTATFTVILKGDAPGADESVGVTYTTADVTATAGQDYTAATDTLTFAQGETSKTITVPITDDLLDEANETFTVTLSNPTGTISGAGITISETHGTATATITDNDAPVDSYTLAADLTSVTEGDEVTFTVSALDADGNPAAPAEDTTFNYQISGVEVAGGTADPATDLGKVTGEVTIEAGQTTGTFTLTPTDDGTTEGFEGFKVSLLDSSFVTVADSGNVVIKDGAEAGQTFTLTTATDSGANFTGGDGNDSFQGTLTFATSGGAGVLTSSATLNPGDNLVGGGGDDTLTITVTGADLPDAGYTANLTTSAIENIVVTNFDSEGAGAVAAADTDKDVTIDLSNTTGVTTIGTASSNNVNADTLFSNVATITNVMMAGKGDLDVAFTTSAVSGATDTLNLTVNDVGTSATAASTFSANGIETLNIMSSTGSNFLNVTAGNYTSVTVSGDQDLTVKVDDADITAFDASTATGVVSADLSAVATLTSFTSVKGGTGTSDKITLGDTNVTVNSTTNDLKNFSGFETLAVTGNGNALTFSADTAGINGFDLSDADNQTLTLNTGYTGATTVTITGDNGDTITNSANVELTVIGNADDLDGTITGGTGTDTVNVYADGGTRAIAAGVTNIENINVLAHKTTSSTVVGLTTDNANVATGKTLTVDASALTSTAAAFTFNGAAETDGVFHVTGGAAADSLAGGSGADTISGGGGNDSIDGGAGNDILTGGDGIDSITAGAGNDSIDGGAGNDVINLAGNLTTNDSIDGGDGTDTLSVTSLSADGLTNVSNVENLAVSGAGSSVSLTSNLSFTTIDIASQDDNAQTVTFSTGYTNATTVKVDAGDTVTNTAADIELTVEANATDLQTADSTTISGSDKTGVTNTLTLTNNAVTVDMTAATNKITNIDVVNIKDATTAGYDLQLDVEGYGVAGDSLTIDASELDSGENLTINGASDANLMLTGTAGVNDIDLGNGNDSLTLGAGNDTIDINDASDFTFADSIDGGAGNDTITLNADTAVTDSSFTNVSNVEFVVLDTTNAGVTLGTNATKAGITKITGLTGAANTINAAATSTGIEIVASTANATNDTLTGGSGDDTFTFSGTTGLQDGDSIDGTAGTDTIQLDNSAGAVTAELDFDDITGVTKIAVKDDDGGNAATAQAIGVTFSAVAETTAQTVTLDASKITDSNDALTVTNNAASSTTVFNITGGAGADTLVGSNGKDSLQGGNGADTLSGGQEADTLTGGAGADKFTYTATGLASGTNAGTSTDSTSAKTDTIADFAAGTDKIVLTATLTDATNTFYGKDAGDATSLSNGTALLTADNNGQYFFNTTDHQLVVDLDGNGLIQATDLVINMTGLTGFSETDMVMKVTGGTGIDTITTGDGDDVVLGGDEADVITTGSGNDYLQGSAAGDGSDADVMKGGAGNDTYAFVTASAANNLITETSGTDTIYVGATVSLANLEIGADNTGAASTDLIGATDALKVEQIVIADTFTATFNDQQISGNAIAINSANGGGTVGLTVAGDDGAADTIDLSNLTFTSVNYVDSTGTSVAGAAFDASDTLTVDGGTGNDVITLSSAKDTLLLGSTATTNGTDAVTSFTLGASGDVIDINFGDGGNADLAALRGDGTVASSLAAGGALATNTGFVVYTADVADAAAAELAAEGLTGEGAGDIVYFLASADYDASATATLYSATYAGAGDAAITSIATFASVTLSGINQANLADWGAIA